MIDIFFDKQIKRNFSVATIWVSGGSDMDSQYQKGINHLLCSLLIRGCEGFDDLALSNYVESYGGELTQEVFEDGISISIKTLNANFDKLFPLLDLIINKPILSKFEFKKVKKSTLNFLRKEKENPFNIGFEKWKKIVYSNHPYAFNTNGYEKDVSKISYNNILIEYEKFKERKKYLISNNIKINGKSLEIFDQIIHSKESIYQNYNLNQSERFTSSNNESNQIIIMLGNQTCSRLNSEYLILKVLESYLSCGMSSLLFKLFREKNGITYDVGVYNPIRKSNAPFLVYLSVSNKNAILAFEILSKLWKELKFSKIPDQEIHLAKEKLKSSFLINNQSLDEILLRKIQLISYGVLLDSEKKSFAKIEDINSQDVKKVINKYLGEPFLSVTGDKNICKEIKKLWIEKF